MNRDWRQRAACTDVKPQIFFPVSFDDRMTRSEVESAKAVCAVCPVREDCLEFALEALPYGVAGGMTPAERRRVRAERRAAERDRGAA